MYSKKSINTSAEALNTGKNLPGNTEDNQDLKIYNKEKKRARNQGLSHLYHNDYKPAVYKKAVEFKDSMSYKKKIGENSYKQLQMFEDTNQLKNFGLGPYFFIQFQRRIVWLFLILTIIEGIRIYINYKGTGLSSYQGSFSTYLVVTTVGNFNGNVLSNYDLYIQTIIPAATYFIMFIFYLWWKCHYSAAIDEENQSKQFIKPEKFCVQISGFDENDNVKEEQLQNIFSAFGPVYEVSLARQYAGNLKYFQELDGLQEQIKQQQLEIILGSGDQENLKALRKQKDELSKYISTLRIKPSVRSAFVHFQFQKSKVDMLQYFSDHYLFENKNTHSLVRSICCCCVNEPDQKYLYKGKKLYVINEKVPEPEDINWDSYQVGICGKIFRLMFSTLIILVFLAVSCTIIGLCSVYISSHSVSCEGMKIPPDVKQAQTTLTTQKQKKCFCNANFIASFNSDPIKVYCGELLNQVYTEQGIQYAITFTSTIVNLIFCFIVHKLVNMAQPSSLSTGYLWKTTIITIFLIFNTVILPLLIYADIFGFKATNYVSFITIVSVDARNFFQVDSIKFYVDYQKIWYRNVSPIFTNYIVLDIALTWVFFILYKCCCSKESLESKEGSILQKNMNLQITSWKLQAADEYAMFNLIIVMGIFYSSGIPALIPLAFINLLSKYISNRHLLQSVSSRIDGLSQAFNAFPITLIPLLLMVACINGSWMLTGNQLIYNFQNMKINFGENNWWVLDRQLILPFFIILALVVLFYFAFYNTVIRFCSWLASSCYDQKKVVHPYYTREYSHYAKTMSIMHSYNIRNNLKYKNVIFNLQKYLDSQQLKM